ncbi:unnamed protein product [Commensalibacter communis]|uniref:Uncharacterized protein n=1 Tax=Commensalibacter communis TaxID=2972786 RepID=A0A9W4TPM9_9PROT|nr:unnamed protein product [Commensalibacter communis]CAI3934331.1 unnamed protein product [Commensalibacter communis]CAI3943956.1 unnamed protein product [Commensalibacter communis]CAI3950556.1 unnamed protein product [Commensalibacter communis]CAI3952194.1 unnamed protein product [Commensalibacter communis]
MQKKNSFLETFLYICEITIEIIQAIVEIIVPSIASIYFIIGGAVAAGAACIFFPAFIIYILITSIIVAIISFLYRFI